MSNSFSHHNEDRTSSHPSTAPGPMWMEMTPTDHARWLADPNRYVYGEKPARNVESKRRASARAGRHILLEQELRFRRTPSLGRRLHDGFLALNDEDELL